MTYDMICICREVNKSSGEITVYPIQAEATDKLMAKLAIRHIFNRELRYFAMRKSRFEQNREKITENLKRKNIGEKTIFNLGMVEL